MSNMEEGRAPEVMRGAKSSCTLANMIARIDGRHLQYDVLGDGGMPVIAHVGWGRIEGARESGEALAACGLRVVLWDRSGM